MKKITFLITLTIAGFSATVFAQNKINNRAEQTPDITNSSPISNARAELHITHHNNTFKAKPHETQQNKTHQAHRIASLVAIYDSVYYWNWDTNIVFWPKQADYKYIDMIYDSHQNEISQTYQEWNGSAWVNDQLYTFTFNVNNIETGYAVQDWNGSAWVNSYQYVYTFDAHSNNLCNLSQTWNGSAWTNINQTLYTYDANNNEILSVYQTWSGSAWTNSTQNIYTYDSHNNKSTETQQAWTGSAWGNVAVYYYTYNANNYETNETDQKWTGSAWVNSYQYAYTYDANNNCIVSLSQSWNGTAWVNTNQYTYTYNANNSYTSFVEQTWNGSAWVLNAQTLYAYDANNNEVSEVDESWIGIWVDKDEYLYSYNANNCRIEEYDQTWVNSGWVNTSVYGYTFDANNMDLSYSEKDYDITGTKVINGDSSYNYIHDVLGIKTISVKNNISVYPNPSDGKFTVQWSVINKHSILKIYNVTGQEVSITELNGNTNQVDLSLQPNGVYFYKALAENGEIYGQGKIIIQK
jgi:hypothetical protein